MGTQTVSSYLDTNIAIFLHSGNVGLTCSFPQW